MIDSIGDVFSGRHRLNVFYVHLTSYLQRAILCALHYVLVLSVKLHFWQALCVCVCFMWLLVRTASEKILNIILLIIQDSLKHTVWILKKRRRSVTPDNNVPGVDWKWTSTNPFRRYRRTNILITPEVVWGSSRFLSFLQPQCNPAIDVCISVDPLQTGTANSELGVRLLVLIYQNVKLLTVSKYVSTLPLLFLRRHRYSELVCLCFLSAGSET